MGIPESLLCQSRRDDAAQPDLPFKSGKLPKQNTTGQKATLQDTAKNPATYMNTSSVCIAGRRSQSPFTLLPFQQSVVRVELQSEVDAR